MNICSNELDEKTNDNDQSKMLCNVIVRATEELYVNQQKSRIETEIFLKNDCEKLQTPQLIEKVNIFKITNQTISNIHFLVSRIC